MADLDRNDSLAVVQANPMLKREHLKIQISEKLNQIRQLEVRLEHMREVEEKQVCLKIEILKIGVDRLREELSALQRNSEVIEGEVTGG